MGNVKLQDIIGVIFDFNGTMFFDSEKHIKAWSTYVSEMTGKNLSYEEIQKYIVGNTPDHILEHFLGCELTPDMVAQLSEEKEGIYRKLCNEDGDKLSLAPGLSVFLDYLSEYNIPKTIATTASLSNVMYYFEKFDLYKWFEPDKIVYQSSKLRPKPYPDMYLVACKLIDKRPDRCLVFEDSVTGITSAEKAGIKHIVAVRGDNPNLSLDGFDHIRAVIKDYTELDENINI